tara:strand:- start:15255 stop:15728 length:474 start_codon:yes stop_codon:yes gene_type:complete
MNYFNQFPSFNVLLKNKEETINFGEQLAKEISPSSIILLKGPLGVGKTSIIQGLAKGLGIQEPVNSPTFPLSQHYQSNMYSLVHMDFYRIEKHDDALELFLQEEEEANQNGSIIAIEWPEILGDLFSNNWILDITYNKDFSRNLFIQRPSEIRKLFT